MSTHSGHSYGKTCSRCSMLVGAHPPSYNLTTLAEISGLLRNNNSNTIMSEGGVGEETQDMREGTRKDGEYTSITRPASPTQGSTAKIPPSITSREVDSMPPIVNGMRSNKNNEVPIKNGLNDKNTYIPPPASVVEVKKKSPVIDSGKQQNMSVENQNMNLGHLHSSYTDMVRVNTVQKGHKQVQDGSNKSITGNIHDTEQKYIDNDRYIEAKGKNRYRKSSCHNQIRTSGSRYFNTAFESSENDSVNSNGDEELIRTSIPSMSIPTTQGTRPVDLNYRKFTEGILSELPIEEQTRILRRAEKVYSLRMNNTKIIHSAEFKDPTSADDTSSTKITGFSQRYTRSQKGKAKDMRPSTMKHRVEQPEIREQIIAEQIEADEQLARHTTQNDAETEHIPQFIPRIGTSGKRQADNPIITSAHSVRLSQEKDLGQEDAKYKRTGSPSYMNNLPGVYQLRNAIPGGRQASVFPN
ncbi:hypothetical protein M422DRAFT_240679 [Sphaerobolus stellatus SS14]|nr:hypothetical protein M422DRAFT_240679 [Sphaerobolus stellatus SS14]